jgi:hypothetical protein
MTLDSLAARFISGNQEMTNNVLVPIGYVTRALNVPAHHVRVHAQELGFTIHLTKKGHRRFDVEEIRRVAERMWQERLAEVARMFPL